MESEMKTFDDNRRKILQDFPVDEIGKPIIPAERIDEVDKKFDELVSIEVEAKFYTMKFSDLCFEITPIQMNAIMPLLLED